MGSGKSTVCRSLLKLMPHTAFLDGDWCWAMYPFVVTKETRRLVLDNICHHLKNFLLCNEFQNVLFCWVMHDQSIMDAILQRLPLKGVQTHCFTLDIAPEVLLERLNKDIASGRRKTACVELSLRRLPLYAGMNTQKIDVNRSTPEEIARRIRDMIPGFGDFPVV